MKDVDDMDDDDDVEMDEKASIEKFRDKPYISLRTDYKKFPRSSVPEMTTEEYIDYIYNFKPPSMTTEDQFGNADLNGNGHNDESIVRPSRPGKVSSLPACFLSTSTNVCDSPHTSSVSSAGCRPPPGFRAPLAPRCPCPQVPPRTCGCGRSASEPFRVSVTAGFKGYPKLNRQNPFIRIGCPCIGKLPACFFSLPPCGKNVRVRPVALYNIPGFDPRIVKKT